MDRITCQVCGVKFYSEMRVNGQDICTLKCQIKALEQRAEKAEKELGEISEAFWLCQDCCKASPCDEVSSQFEAGEYS